MCGNCWRRPCIVPSFVPGGGPGGNSRFAHVGSSTGTPHSWGPAPAGRIETGGEQRRWEQKEPEQMCEKEEAWVSETSWAEGREQDSRRDWWIKMRRKKPEVRANRFSWPVSVLLFNKSDGKMMPHAAWVTMNYREYTQHATTKRDKQECTDCHTGKHKTPK